MSLPGGQLEWGRERVSVDDQAPRAHVAIPPRNDDVIGPRIPSLPRFEHDDRAVQPRGQLCKIAEVRVVDERAGARQREARDERVPGRNRRCDAAAHPAPAGDAVRVALELDAVPVNGGRLLQAIHHGDVGRAAARQDECGAGYLYGVHRRNGTAVQHIPHGTWRGTARWHLLDDQR